MINFRKYIYMAVAASIALTSCDDNKVEYVPAEPDSPNCMGVYFDANNESNFIFIPGEGSTVTLTMHREKTDAAADVPIIGKCTADGVVFPATAHFDAGSADTQITLDCNNLPIGQMVKISVDIPQEYINHYAETLFNYETTALVSKWEPANTDGSPVKFYFTASDYGTSNSLPTPAIYQPVESEMEVLPGASMIRIQNFLNSGVEMTFRFTESPYDDFAGYYRVYPTDHYYTFVDAYEDEAYGDGWYNPWFLLNGVLDEDGEEDYADLPLTDLDGNASTFSYPAFYSYSDSEAFEQSYAMFKTSSHKYNTVSMGFTGTPEGTVTLPTYFYVFFRWDGPSGI